MPNQHRTNTRTLEGVYQDNGTQDIPRLQCL
jgi:hypothetical protein